jgi:hypothetical protein
MKNKAEIFGFLKPSTEGNLFTAPNAKINVPDQRELWRSTRTYPQWQPATVCTTLV